MDSKYNKKIIPNAKTLRKNMTPEERRIWYDFLRDYPVKFRRQQVLGQYIADFYCASAKLIIEIDGSQHYEEKGSAEDAIRTNYLEQFGLSVIRIPNNEINRDFDAVCEFLDREIMLRVHK